MKERETAEAIEDRAVEWVARIDRSADDPQVQVGLEEWLAADDRRRGAYFRALAAWHMLDRASVFGAGGREESAETGPKPSRRHLLWGGALAASIVASIAGIGLWPASPEQIQTAVGEIRRVPLDDGSVAEMNTDTKLAVLLKAAERQVALDRGEAWFQVAKDKARPFVVEAGGVRVRAVGTAFSVRRLEEGADVLVTEGGVDVWSVGDEADVKRVPAGSRAFVDDETGAQQVTEARLDIERRLAWRSGHLILDGTTLGEAAAEFNRYNRVKLTIGDQALAQEKLVGRFRTNEPDAFARTAAIMLEARVTISGNEIRLSQD